jgi:hypothetical protein
MFSEPSLAVNWSTPIERLQPSANPLHARRQVRRFIDLRRHCKTRPLFYATITAAFLRLENNAPSKLATKNHR